MLSQLKLKQIYDFLFTYFRSEGSIWKLQQKNLFSLFWMFPNLIPIPGTALSNTQLLKLRDVVHDSIGKIVI